MKNLEELHKIRKEKRKELDLRVNTKADTREKHILVCHGTGCTSSKSPEILEKFRKVIEENNLTNVRVIMTGCFGLCARGPIVIIRPEDTFYSNVKIEDCEEIIKEHIIGGRRVERLLCKDIDGKLVNKLDDLNFYKKQKIFSIISNIEIKYFLSLFVIWEVTVSRILFRNRFVIYSMDVSCFLRESDFLFFCCVSFATLFLPLSKSI